MLFRRKAAVAVVLAVASIAVLLGGLAFMKEEALPARARMFAYLMKTRKRKPNVILITLDTLRRDRLGCYGYSKKQTPNLDLFSQEGVMFTRANTCVPITLPSHTSILTGLYPTSHGVRDNGKYTYKKDHLTITEALKSEGYETAAFVSSFVLDSRFGLDKGFNVYDDDFSHSILSKIRWRLPKDTYSQDYDSYERRGDEVTQQAIDWLKKNKEKKFFLWVHYFDPHAPYYEYSEDGTQIIREAPQSSDSSTYTEESVRQAIRLYDGEVQFVDSSVGKLLNTLAHWDLYENSLIVIVSDHGESLGEHDYYFQHGGMLFETMLRVPFLMHMPYGGPGKVVVNDFVRTIDIAPTVYQLLGIEPKAKLDGTSLIPLIFGIDDPPPAETYCETFLPLRDGQRPFRGIKTKRYKLVIGSGPGANYLFDLQFDPNEMNNLLRVDEKGNPVVHREYVEVLAKLGERLNTLIKTTEPQNVQTQEGVDKETEHKLKSLGYM